MADQIAAWSMIAGAFIFFITAVIRQLRRESSQRR